MIQKLDWNPKTETYQHYKAKQEIVLACKSMGYEAFIEERGPDWRADVLATKNSQKIVFEVQLSPQSWEKTLKKQEKYKRDGVKCYTFDKRYSTKDPDLPIFHISWDSNNSLFVPLETKSFPLIDFVQAILSNRVRLCQELQAIEKERVFILFFEMQCWRCGVPTHVYCVYEDPYYSYCGMKFIKEISEATVTSLRSEEIAWLSGINPFDSRIQTKVEEFLRTDEGKDIKLGSVKPRFSKTVGRSYMSFGCCHCDCLLGDHFVSVASADAMYEREKATILKVTLSEENLRGKWAHWCFPEDGRFCEV